MFDLFQFFGQFIPFYGLCLTLDKGKCNDNDKKEKKEKNMGMDKDKDKNNDMEKKDKKGKLKNKYKNLLNKNPVWWTLDIPPPPLPH